MNNLQKVSYSNSNDDQAEIQFDEVPNFTNSYNEQAEGGRLEKKSKQKSSMQLSNQKQSYNDS